jgi:hypothetical protein
MVDMSKRRFRKPFQPQAVSARCRDLDRCDMKGATAADVVDPNQSPCARRRLSPRNIHARLDRRR